MHRPRMSGVLAVALLSGCWTEKYEEVGVHLNRLLRDPDRACAWIQEHAGTYDGEFAGCGQEQLDRIGGAIDDALDYCYGHYSDPDLVRLCTEGRGVPDLENKEAALVAVLEITVRANGCAMIGCDCAAFGALFQPLADLFDQTAAEQGWGTTWDETMDGSLEAQKKEYTCKDKRNVLDEL